MKNYHSPDEFMFRSFDIHSRIFHHNNLNDYFMISSGTNQFSMPQIWKESISKELDTDFLYRWYTASDGFQCITSSIKVYEDYLSGTSHLRYNRSERKVCMTAGGSGAASMVFEYLQSVFGRCHIILVGMNYSLYERLAKKHLFSIQELRGEDETYSIPNAKDFHNLSYCSDKTIFVFSIPNNPTGENYSVEQFSEIVYEIERCNGFIILDQVCNLVISKQTQPMLETVITNHNYWHNCAIINSFSKTEAIAGFRIGYIYGEENLINFCSKINANTIMNPPTFPAFPIVLTCLFRCLYINNSMCNSPTLYSDFQRLFRKLFYITTAVIPASMREYTDSVFENLNTYYLQYIEEQLENEVIMQNNYVETCRIFKPYIRKVSKLQNGFNFCIWFRNSFKMDELTLIEELLNHTGVAILTESAFSLRSAHKNDFFIRFSTACNCELYASALQRMNVFLESEGFAF